MSSTVGTAANLRFRQIDRREFTRPALEPARIRRAIELCKGRTANHGIQRV